MGQLKTLTLHVLCTRSKRKKRTCFLFRCRSTAKETNYNINVYTANREPYSRTAIAMLKIQGAADK